jgi:hypothetical protein
VSFPTSLGQLIDLVKGRLLSGPEPATIFIPPDMENNLRTWAGCPQPSPRGGTVLGLGVVWDAEEFDIK